MPTRYRDFSTRSTHKARKNWAIIDVELFERLMREGRTKGVLPSDHDGRCLFILEKRVRVGSAFGAYSENQARLYAANGGNWYGVDKTNKNGQPRSFKFRDRRQFAAVEFAVLDFLRQQAVITWDLSAVRSQMFALLGERILSSLCTTFIPPATTIAGMKAEARREHGEMERRSGQKDRPRPTTRKTPLIAYKVIDLDEFRFRRAEALQEAVEAGACLENAKAHEGNVLRRATSSANISAASWRAAIDKFRFRVQGARGCLEYGRFIALAKSEWERLVELESLPLQMDRDSLRKLLCGLPKKREEKPSIFTDKDWWLKYEPGCDPEAWEAQLTLVPMLYESEEELMEFPPRERRRRQKPAIQLTPAMRKWRPPRFKVKRMRQLDLKFAGEWISPFPMRMYDARNPDQLLLFNTRSMIGAPKTRWKRKRMNIKRGESPQLELRF